jgi:hypothetical protein
MALKHGDVHNGARFKNWVLRRRRSIAWRKLAGFNDGDRQMVKILAAVLTMACPRTRLAFRRSPRASLPPTSIGLLAR